MGGASWILIQKSALHVRWGTEALDGQLQRGGGGGGGQQGHRQRQPEALGVAERLAEDPLLAPTATGDQNGGQSDGTQRAPAALLPSQQSVDQDPQHALQRRAGARITDLHRLLQSLLHTAWR